MGDKYFPRLSCAQRALTPTVLTESVGTRNQLAAAGLIRETGLFS
jgi:hypothetical protein